MVCACNACTVTVQSIDTMTCHVYCDYLYISEYLTVVVLAVPDMSHDD